MPILLVGGNAEIPGVAAWLRWKVEREDLEASQLRAMRGRERRLEETDYKVRVAGGAGKNSCRLVGGVLFFLPYRACLRKSRRHPPIRVSELQSDGTSFVVRGAAWRGAFGVGAETGAPPAAGEKRDGDGGCSDAELRFEVLKWVSGAEKCPSLCFPREISCRCFTGCQKSF